MSSSSTKVCFNSECRVSQSEIWRRGWRLQIPGQYAELCDRCAFFFEEGRFCETFHVKGSGWRCCESCGKRVHCGCIASIHAFILLDVGGVECIACARKNAILATNSTWPSPSVLLSVPNADKYKELPSKSWSHIAGAGPVPWRQAPSFFTSSLTQSESLSRAILDRDFSTTIDRMKVGERIPFSPLEKRRIEDSSDRLMNGALKLASDMFENGNGAIKYEERNNCSSNAQQLSSLKVDPRTPQPGSIPSSVFPAGSNGLTVVPGSYPRLILPSQSIGADPPSEIQIQSGRSQGNGRSKNHFFSRYLPRITEEELQKLSGDSNSKITPLFEKMLSASDAGKIGRLVLPKKCAEAYLPPISQPEGLPLRVQDLKGQEWVFQFRFWPNNNSRMYVLEGVTPCIQSMQLQAGDIVTFNRIEPEGKLVMGFRKAASGASSDQGIQANKSATVAYTPMAAESVDPSATLSKVDKSSYIATEVLKTKPSMPRKRKTSTLVPKSKRLMVDNVDLLELKITWEEAQGLLRPPPSHLPSTVMVEGYEFEEYMDAPIIGKPTIFATGPACEKVQWVQCEKCSKWRRLPADAVIPSGWNCFQNSWDSERSGCSATQELKAEQLNELLSTCNVASSKKLKPSEEDSDVVEALEGLDALADLAILAESKTTPSSTQATTKHPRHKVGCSCIVCIQPPSGKGHKPRDLCSCNVCLTVKSRFRTQMLRRERKQQSDKDDESAGEPQVQDNDSLLGDSQGEDSPGRKDALDHSDNDTTKNRSPISPFKGHIDLNIQPEREDTSPRSDSCFMARFHQDTAETHLRERQALLSSNKRNENFDNQSQLDEGGEKGSLGPSVTGATKNEVVVSTNHQQVLVGHPVEVSMNTPASTSTSR